MAPAEIRIRDYAENLFLFLRELNGRDFSIGFSEHERIRRLLARLAAEGRIPDDLGALKPYLAAVVCTTRAQQKEFYRRYERWAARFAPDDGKTGAKMSPETDPVEEFEKLGFRFRKWIPVFLSAAILLVFGTVVWLTTDFGRVKKPVAGNTVAVPGSIPSAPSQRTPTENQPQPITTTPPIVESKDPGGPAHRIFRRRGLFEPFLRETRRLGGKAVSMGKTGAVAFRHQMLADFRKPPAQRPGFYRSARLG